MTVAHYTTACITVRCDRCLMPATASDGTPRHWPSLEQAVSVLSGPSKGWEADHERQTCAACVIELTCLNAGHAWEAWQPVLPLDDAPAAAHRICARCGLDESTVLEEAGERPGDTR